MFLSKLKTKIAKQKNKHELCLATSWIRKCLSRAFIRVVTQSLHSSGFRSFLDSNSSWTWISVGVKCLCRIVELHLKNHITRLATKNDLPTNFILKVLQTITIAIVKYMYIQQQTVGPFPPEITKWTNLVMWQLKQTNNNWKHTFYMNTEISCRYLV